MTIKVTLSFMNIVKDVKGLAQLGGNPGSMGGLSRIKSSNLLFTVDKNARSAANLGVSNLIKNPHAHEHSLESGSGSDLSVGDAAYPIIGFATRAVKEFTPKSMILGLNSYKK
jgi:hypothetical protein